jgi:hypothetical protein
MEKHALAIMQAQTLLPQPLKNGLQIFHMLLWCFVVNNHIINVIPKKSKPKRTCPSLFETQ